MVTELDKTNVKYSKEVWLRLLRTWVNYIKSSAWNSFTDASSDMILKQMLDDDFLSVS